MKRAPSVAAHLRQVQAAPVSRGTSRIGWAAAAVMLLHSLGIGQRPAEDVFSASEAPTEIVRLSSRTACSHGCLHVVRGQHLHEGPHHGVDLYMTCGHCGASEQS